MAALTFVDPALEEEFARQGFVRVRLMSAADAGRLHAQLGALLPQPLVVNTPPNYSSAAVADAATRDASAARCVAVLAPSIAALVDGGRIGEASLIAKPAGGGALGLHHHMPFTDRPFGRTIVCWLALTDTDADTSALTVVPGSHGLLPFIPAPGGPRYFDAFGDRLQDEAVSVAVSAGEALLFDNSLLHGSSPNLGAQDRLAISALVVPQDSRNALTIALNELEFAVMDTGDGSAVARYYVECRVPDEWRRLRVLPNRNRAITAAEFSALIARGDKATETHDPLDAVRGPAEARRTGRGVLARLRSWARARRHG